jgi:hypothetical protein
MSTKQASGKSVSPDAGTKGQTKDTGKVVAPKPNQKPGASRPLGVTSTGSVKISD